MQGVCHETVFGVVVYFLKEMQNVLCFHVKQETTCA